MSSKGRTNWKPLRMHKITPWLNFYKDLELTQIVDEESALASPSILCGDFGPTSWINDETWFSKARSNILIMWLNIHQLLQFNLVDDLQ